MTRKKRNLVGLIGIGLILVLLAAWIISGRSDSTSSTPTTSVDTNSDSQHSQNDEQPEDQGFNKQMFSISEPGSIWWVVNKTRPLPDNYTPELTVPNVTLRLAATAEQMQFGTSATPALEEMFAAAEADGISIVFGSGYRSYNLQKQFYDSYVAQDGQVAADRYSARPGTSEHQTGLSFDATASNGACHLEICFEDTPEGQWLAKNAHKYGFIIRYPESKENITGYQYEPWHLRYVGVELASEMHHQNISTLEEFFNLPPAPDYN